jgi:hypothetical protein
VTVTTANLDAAVTGADVKHSGVVGVADFAVWLATHPDVTWPTLVMNIEVAGETLEEQLADLARIARQYESPVTSDPCGMRMMTRRFDGLTVVACVSPWTRFGTSPAGTGAAA